MMVRKYANTTRDIHTEFCNSYLFQLWKLENTNIHNNRYVLLPYLDSNLVVYIVTLSKLTVASLQVNETKKGLVIPVLSFIDSISKCFTIIYI